jgi:1,4-dihydroxy-2-naphthoate polyprenyltransferase
MTLRQIWAFIRLTRPLFLGGAVVVYLFGAALALTQGAAINWPRLLLGQLLVTSIQLVTHYANEYYDYEVDRLIGDRRTPFSGGSGVLVSGQLDRRVALNALRVCLAIATVMLIVSGLAIPVMWIIGALALLGGYFYSAPPLSLEGSGFGELDTVLLTALLVPLTGYTMQVGHIDTSVLNFAAPLILIDLAMILTFEFADYPADQTLGKRNIAVRIGLRRAAWLHQVLLIGGLVLLFTLTPVKPWLVWLVLPLTLWQIVGVAWRSRSGWKRFALLSGGAVLLSGLIPAGWLIELLLSIKSLY